MQYLLWHDIRRTEWADRISIELQPQTGSMLA
jgi:hypothetical protein